MARQCRRLLPYLRLLGAQVAIGAAAIFARYALQGAGPLAVSALRLAIAALVAVLLVRDFKGLGARREAAFALAGVALAAHFAAWIASLEYTSVAISTLLVTTTPLWTEAYDALRERRPPTTTMLASLLLGMSGVAAIAFAKGATPPPIPGHIGFGAALALGGAIAIGAYLILVRNAGAAPGKTRLGTRRLVARTYTWAALTLLVAATFAHQSPPPLADGTAWFGILAMALGSQLLGHTALNAALKDFSPSVIALSTLLEPIVAAALAALLFGEALSWQAAGGGALILAAVGLTLRDTIPPVRFSKPIDS